MVRSIKDDDPLRRHTAEVVVPLFETDLFSALVSMYGAVSMYARFRRTRMR